MESRWFTLLLPQLLVQLPLWVAWLVGIVLALVFWRKHPRPSMLALIAVVLLLLQSLVGIVELVWIVSQMRLTTEQRGVLVSLLAGARTIISTVAWGLLLGAQFGWRK